MPISHEQPPFEKFARRCPVCNGHVYRDFTFLEKVCLFLPFHLFLKAKHHCDSCGAKFYSRRNLTDFVFVGLFSLGTYLLKEDWAASFIVPARRQQTAAAAWPLDFRLPTHAEIDRAAGRRIHRQTARIRRRNEQSSARPLCQP